MKKDEQVKKFNENRLTKKIVANHTDKIISVPSISVAKKQRATSTKIVFQQF